ncbi:MAG TPA: DUF1192 domain-containing protein [Roseiarcus sp.]
MATLEEDQAFGKRPAAPPAHVLGQSLDDLSAPELVERIATLKREIERLEAAIQAREITRQAASSFFKT